MLSQSFQGARTISLPSTLLGKVVGVLSWLLRGLNLSSSLYTFKECIPCLARDRHFTGSPELTHSLLKHFCLRGTGFLVLPCVYQIPPLGQNLSNLLMSVVNLCIYYRTKNRCCQPFFKLLFLCNKISYQSIL